MMFWITGTTPELHGEGELHPTGDQAKHSHYRPQSTLVGMKTQVTKAVVDKRYQDSCRVLSPTTNRLIDSDHIRQDLEYPPPTPLSDLQPNATPRPGHPHSLRLPTLLRGN